MSTPPTPNHADENSRFEARHTPPREAVTVERRPLAYAPASATQLNHDRLPPRNELDSMSLAFRLEEDDAARRYSSRSIIAWVPLGLLFLILATLSLTRLLPFEYTAGLAGGATLWMLLAATFGRTLNTRKVARAFLLPMFAVVVAYAISGLIHHRMVAAAVLSLLTGLAAWRWLPMPIRFYRDWIAADPRLLPADRERLMAERAPRPTYWLLGAVLAVATIVPYFSTTLAMVIIVAACVAVCLRSGVSRLQHRHALDVLGRLLSYGLSDAGAPGVWRPAQSSAQRRRRFLLLAGSLLFSLGVGLSLFYPWDVARGPFLRVLTDDVPSLTIMRPVFDTPNRSVEWESMPPPLPREVRRNEPPKRSMGSTIYNAPPNRESAPRAWNEQRSERLRQAAERDNEFRESFGSGWRGRFLRQEIGDRPYTWFFTSIAGVLAGNLLFLWWLPIAFLLALLIPNLVLYAVYHDALVTLGDLRRGVESGKETTERAEGPDDQPRQPWQWYVDRLASSTHRAADPVLTGASVHEADHLFMGVEPHAGFPVLLDRSLLNQHCYIVGQTGSGKTSLGLMPMLIQLLRQGFDPRQDNPPVSDGSQRNEPPLVIIDLKGDPALFHTAMREAEARRKRHGVTRRNDPRYTFRFFTPEPGRDSYHFNPFRSMDSEHRSAAQLCELMLDSLSLSHGEGYGRSYYTRRNRAMLFEALEDDSKPRSFEDLYEVLKRMLKSGGTDDLRFDVFELLATVQSLENYKALATDDSELPEASTIHFPTALENRQVIYFWLPAATESVSVREIGKLALYSLLSAAIDRQRDGGEEREVILMIDEFQRIAAENFRIILEQARSFGICAVLANQSISDLVSNDTDLRPAIRTNTRVKLYFSVSDPIEMEDLSTVSGEELVVSKTYGYGYVPPDAISWGLTSISESETIKPRLLKSDIIRSSDHPLEYILHVSQGSGYTQFGGIPIPVQTRWPIAYADFSERTRAPWPKIEATKTIRPAVQEEAPKDIDRDAAAEFVRRKRPVAQAMFEELQRRFGQIPPDERIR